MKRALIALLILLALPVLGFAVIAFAVPSDRLVAILEQRIDNAAKTQEPQYRSWAHPS